MMQRIYGLKQNITISDCQQITEAIKWAKKIYNSNDKQEGFSSAIFPTVDNKKDTRYRISRLESLLEPAKIQHVSKEKAKNWCRKLKRQLKNDRREIMFGRGWPKNEPVDAILSERFRLVEDAYNAAKRAELAI